MAAGRHVGFRSRCHNVWTAWARHYKFGTGLEIHGGNVAKLPQLTKIKIQHGRRPTLITRKHWAGFQSHWVRWIIQNISAKRISTVLYSPILCVHVLIDERNAFLFYLFIHEQCSHQISEKSIAQIYSNHAKFNGNSRAIKPLTQCLINMVLQYYTR